MIWWWCFIIDRYHLHDSISTNFFCVNCVSCLEPFGVWTHSNGTRKKQRPLFYITQLYDFIVFYIYYVCITREMWYISTFYTVKYVNELECIVLDLLRLFGLNTKSNDLHPLCSTVNDWPKMRAIWTKQLEDHVRRCKWAKNKRITYFITMWKQSGKQPAAYIFWNYMKLICGISTRPPLLVVEHIFTNKSIYSRSIYLTVIRKL